MELSSIRRCFITYRECNANTDFPTLYSSLHFNQRTRMGCDLPCCTKGKAILTSTNAPAWGATEDRVKNRRGDLVSIHAPAWGATCKGWRTPPSLLVSIHAPTWGATLPPVAFANSHKSFNPRTRTGCDPPVRWMCCDYSCFNPRTRTGCDILFALKLLYNALFQSTHPHGVRPFQPSDALAKSMFQSTHPHGVRLGL